MRARGRPERRNLSQLAMYKILTQYQRREQKKWMRKNLGVFKTFAVLTMSAWSAPMQARARTGVRPECAHADQKAPGARPCAPECAWSAPTRARERNPNAPGMHPCAPDCSQRARMRIDVPPECAHAHGARPCAPECACSAPMDTVACIGVRPECTYAHRRVHGMRACTSKCARNACAPEWR